MISVIIPVYNRAEMVAQSLHSLLGQSKPPGEILVVDDGSTDRTAAVVDAFGPPVRRLHQTNQGAAAARNSGLNAACGEWIAFLDSDDYLTSNALEVLHRGLVINEGCGLVYGGMTLFRDGPETGDTLAAPEGSSPVFHPGTFLCRAEIFRKIGGLNPALGAGEWIDWYSRARTAGVVMKPVPHSILFRRIHSGNMTQHRAGYATHYAQMLAQHLKRQRAVRP